MFRSPISFGSTAILVLAIILAACSTTAGSVETPSLPASPDVSEEPEPTPTPSPSPTEAPEEEPSETPVPSTPPSSPDPTPVPTAKPINVVRLENGSIGRVTADGVAVRVLPGLHQPIIEGYAQDGHVVPEVRLSEGDTVGIWWGPVFADGHTWYEVVFGDTGNVTWDSRSAWIAADFLEVVKPMALYPTLASSDGVGSGKAVTGTVTDNSPLYVNAVVTPMPDDESCGAELVVVGTDGVAITVGAQTVTEATHFFSSPLEHEALYQVAAGDITLRMQTDCSWAAMAFVPQG